MRPKVYGDLRQSSRPVELPLCAGKAVCGSPLPRDCSKASTESLAEQHCLVTKAPQPGLRPGWQPCGYLVLRVGRIRHLDMTHMAKRPQPPGISRVPGPLKATDPSHRSSASGGSKLGLPWQQVDPAPGTSRGARPQSASAQRKTQNPERTELWQVRSLVTCISCYNVATRLYIDLLCVAPEPQFSPTSTAQQSNLSEQTWGPWLCTAGWTRRSETNTPSGNASVLSLFHHLRSSGLRPTCTASFCICAAWEHEVQILVETAFLRVLPSQSRRRE